MGGKPRAGGLSCVVGVANPVDHILLFCKVIAEIGTKWSHFSRVHYRVGAGLEASGAVDPTAVVKYHQNCLGD